MVDPTTLFARAVGVLNSPEVEAIGVDSAVTVFASLGAGAVGVLHGSMSYVLQNDDGQIAEAHSISAGLDYPGVGPEHSYYKDIGRFQYASVTDAEALEGFRLLARLEGIMPALESAHAIAYAMRAASTMKKSQTVVVGLSGRGDKDVHTVGQALGDGDGRPPSDGRGAR